MNGQRCPSCGEYDVVRMDHPHSNEEHLDGHEEGHSYCRNCDWGVCADC